MSQATIIEKKIQQYYIDDDRPHRVCAYCRVSTDKSDQKNSFETQQRFFQRFFDSHPNWNIVGIFSDEGISGTQIDKRDQFLKMIELAKHKQIDLIITKDVSRFSRNVLDTITICKELHEKGVFVWFINDDINTQETNYTNILSDYANNAQKESFRTSNRVRFGQANQMELGVVFGRKQMFGYNIKKDENGKDYFEIIEKEAEVVRKVFEWFDAGDGTYVIARKLENMGYQTKRYKNGWSNTVILRMLRNEKYVGDLLQGKTYTVDVLTHKKKINNGESNKYYIENHHLNEAIIDRELWNRVQKRLEEKSPDEKTKAKHSNRYWSSGKVYCGLCGGRYISYNKKQKYQKYKAWVCFENHQHGTQKERTLLNGDTIVEGCNSKRINDRVLKQAIKDIIVQYIKPNRDRLVEQIMTLFKDPKREKTVEREKRRLEKEIKDIDVYLKSLTDKYVDETIPKDIYLTRLKEKNEEKATLKAKLEAIQNSRHVGGISVDDLPMIKKKIDELTKLSDDDINEDLFGRITKSIVVYPKQIIKINLSILPIPIYMQYKTIGKGKTYDSIFTIISEEEASEALKEYELKM